jgi:signal transduction histidine kinase
MRSAFTHRFRDTNATLTLGGISPTEKVIAFCRVLLAATTFAIMVVDPKTPLWPDIAYPLMSGYVAVSLLLFLLVRSEIVRGRKVGPYSVVLDMVFGVLITLFTERGATPFFLLNLFVIASVSVRWGFAAAAPITIFLAGLYPVLIFVASQWIEPDFFSVQRAHFFRPIYLIALGYLIAYLGEHERRSKQKLSVMLDLTTAIRAGRPPGRALTRIMRRVLDHFDAPRGLVVLRDPESRRYFTWDMDRRRGGRLRLGLRISEHDPFPMAFASSTEAILCNVADPRGTTALCYDVVSGATQRKVVGADTHLPGDGADQALLMVPILVQRELRGRAIVLRKRRPKFAREDMEFLLLVVGQAAAAFEAARLQAKAEEVAVLEERARIARDLHDGFIQSLAGIDLRAEACRKMLDRDPARVPHELEELQQTVERGYREVRHYLNVLRAASREAHDLRAALEQVAAEFSIRERLRVKLELPTDDPGLPPSTGYELTQIVREALRNAVRHGGAKDAMVKLTSYGAHCSLVIRDNGRGFQSPAAAVGADGTVQPAAVPWSIRERTAALGGTLRVRSQAGHGVEIHVVVPATSPQQEQETMRRRIA